MLFYLIRVHDFHAFYAFFCLFFILLRYVYYDICLLYYRNCRS